MSFVRRVVTVSTTLGLTAASLVAAVPTSSAVAARGDGASNVVNVFIARNHTVHMDVVLRPGVLKFVVRSARAAGLQLAMPAAGYTKGEAARDIVAGLNRGNLKALRRFERNVTLFGGVSSTAEKSTVMWANLPRGTYWALDTAPSRPAANDFLTFRVAGERLRATIQQDAVVRAVGEADWARRPSSIPTRGRLTFRNDSTDNHFLILAKLAPGKTMADWRRWLDQIQQGVDAPPPINFSAILDTGVISSGEKMTLRYALPRGNYVMTCFWPDAGMRGLPHAFMGMNRGIRVG